MRRVELTLSDAALSALRQSIESYAPVSDETWSALRAICRVKQILRGHVLYPARVVPDSFAFVFRGLFRVYVSDDKGNEYNKNFFDEGKYPGSMAALHTDSPSVATIEALEDSTVVTIDFKRYRKLLEERHDLKMYQIHYLERNWLLAKDSREIEIVLEDATQRYLRFIEEHGSIATRIPQYHIASHLGITPTQLSRIRKTLG
ncbi:MAG: Crp/Fnr family transcriptional regulator [Halieaceae bacterium]|jgi:CRP-like cAMP-binding protein|nr:Crp/Fnr family transcriptional regulator [Halieaceae bacterium]